MENSKDLIGHKIDLSKLSEQLGDSRVLALSQEASQQPVAKPIQLVFWSLSCSPCLEKLAVAPSATSQSVFTINVDRPEEAPEARETLKKLAPQFEFYQDKNERLIKTFKLDYLPAVVILDKSGTVVSIKAGPNTTF